MTPGTIEQTAKPAKKERTRKEKTPKIKAKTGKLYQHSLKCPLCLGDMKKKAVVSTKCGHVFCRRCLQKALISNPTCPMCRKKISGPCGYHALFLTENLVD